MSSARSVPAGNGVSWLTRGFGTLGKYPVTIGGAVFLLVLAILVPLCIQFAAQFLLTGTTALAVQLLATLAMVLITSLLMIGLLRLIDSLERTGTGSATSIFSTFSDSDLMARAVVFALIVLAVSIVFVVAVLLTLGPDMLGWYKTLITQPMTAGAAAPPITGSPWLSVVVGFVGALALFGVNTFGYAQVALTKAGGVEAFTDGLSATTRNVLPILVNMVVGIVTMLVLVIPMVLVLVVLGFIGGLLHPLAGAVLAVPLYAAFMAGLYALIFATMYHAWRDVFGDPLAPAAASVPPLQLEA
ncbi:MAG: hypothetical protein ABIP49_00850 [Lysobacterales bacterium]